MRKKVGRFHELDGSGSRVRHVRVSEPAVDFEGRGWEPARPAFDTALTSSPFQPIRP